MDLGQVQGVHVCDADDQMNKNTQTRRYIMMPTDSILTNIRVVKTSEVITTMLLYETIDTNANIN